MFLKFASIKNIFCDIFQNTLKLIPASVWTKLLIIFFGFVVDSLFFIFFLIVVICCVTFIAF